MICTELYTKILSGEIDCDDDDIQQQPHRQDDRTATGVAAITGVSDERTPDNSRLDDRTNKRKRIGQGAENQEEKQEQVGQKGPLEGFDDRIFEKDESEFDSTP